MIDEIVAKITHVSSMTEEEVKSLIEEKQIELSGLISEEGAAYLVAKDLGLEIRREQERLNIENVLPGMQNVDVTGKVIRISPTREFKTEKAEGRVSNVTIADKTGSVRISLWNEEIDKIIGMQIGDVIRITGYVKADNLNQAEIRLGRKGDITKVERSDEFDTVAKAPSRVVERANIVDLREGNYRSVRAPILQVFEGNVFYEVCPECKKRASDTDQGFTCQEHGIIEPEYNIVLKGVIDDGTGNIRVTLFNDAAESIIGMKKHDAKKLFDRKKKMEAVLTLVPLGKEFVFEGNVRHNDIFDRIEFVANTVKQVNVMEEIELLTKKSRE